MLKFPLSHISLLPRLHSGILCLFCLMTQRDAEWELSSAHHIQCLSLLSPHEESFSHPSAAPSWGPSHRRNPPQTAPTWVPHILTSSSGCRGSGTVVFSILKCSLPEDTTVADGSALAILELAGIGSVRHGEASGNFLQKTFPCKPNTSC